MLLSPFQSRFCSIKCFCQGGLHVFTFQKPLILRPFLTGTLTQHPALLLPSPKITVLCSQILSTSDPHLWILYFLKILSQALYTLLQEIPYYPVPATHRSASSPDLRPIQIYSDIHCLPTSLITSTYRPQTQYDQTQLDPVFSTAQWAVPHLLKTILGLMTSDLSLPSTQDSEHLESAHSSPIFTARSQAKLLPKHS